MCSTIEVAARCLDVPLAAPDGSERISGHSLRVTGAQGLINLGWSLWAVQLQGRWGSDVVRRYVQDSPLRAASIGRLSPRSSDEPDLCTIVAAVVAKIGSTRSLDASTVQSVTGAPQIDRETVEALDAERSAYGAEPLPYAKHFVLHLRSGTYHRRVATQSRAACGWDYQSSEQCAYVPDASAGPHGWFQLCARCWASLRATAKEQRRPVTLCIDDEVELAAA